MAKESHDSRLARIEEGIEYIHQKLDRLEDHLSPISKRIESHQLEIALLKRDKKWQKAMFSIMAGVFGAGITALVEWIKK